MNNSLGMGQMWGVTANGQEFLFRGDGHVLKSDCGSKGPPP